MREMKSLTERYATKKAIDDRILLLAEQADAIKVYRGHRGYVLQYELPIDYKKLLTEMEKGQ